MNTIPFTKQKVIEYLDKNIEYWRNKMSNTSNEEDILIAQCYVDAYQSVRASLFGQLKK